MAFPFSVLAILLVLQVASEGAWSQAKNARLR